MVIIYFQTYAVETALQKREQQVPMIFSYSFSHLTIIDQNFFHHIKNFDSKFFEIINLKKYDFPVDLCMCFVWLCF